MEMTLGMNCISTKSHNYVLERVLVEVHGVNYDVHVHELGTWNINIVDETLDSSDKLDINGMEKVEDSIDENSLADLNDLNDLKETINELASNENQHQINKENMDQEDDINKVSPEIAVSSDLSQPPGFDHMKRTSKLVILCINTLEWFSFGDMNVVHNENERSGSLFSRQNANNFNSFIDNYGLIDLPLCGRLFTWMNKDGTKLSKIDRFLILKEVAEALPDVRVTAIDRL
ncbi:RNA-directed DNA polymerase, eukaryota, reverse transcriptase zinc-binding domain protein [Tanacetum coccineum]